MSATENPLKRIHRLAIPATIAGIAEPFLSLTDTAIVGNIPVQGAQALAAAGIVGSFLSMLVWVLGQTQSAISALVSQYLGKDNLDGIKALPMQAMYVNVSISLLVLVIRLAIKTDMMTIMNEKIAVIGLGYVGLPLLYELQKRYTCIGLDRTYVFRRGRLGQPYFANSNCCICLELALFKD